MARNNKFGQNWWANRFNQALEKMGWANRLQRGRSYARKGAVLDILMTKEGVQSQVQGSKPRPYTVEVSFKPLNQEEWDRLLTAMAEQAVFTASLLNGEMPAEIENILVSSAVNLFPSSGSDIQDYCSCLDGANPCKHIAAVYYMLGQRFDEDPFLLFELRGLERAEILNRLAEKRRLINEQAKPVNSPNQARKKKGAQKNSSPAVYSGTENTMDFRQTLIQSGANKALNATSSDFWKVGSMPEHQPNWQIPPVPALLLHSQSPPSDWQGPNFMETMTNIYKTSSRNAIHCLHKSGVLTHLKDEDADLLPGGDKSGER